MQAKITEYTNISQKAEEGETDVGLVPGDWKVVSLGTVCKPRKEIVQPTGEGKFRYVGLEHIDPGEPRLKRFALDTEVRSSKYRFYMGDILYGKLRAYLDKAVIAEFDGICSTDIIVISVDKDKTLPDYIVNLLHLPSFVSYATSTMTGVNHPRTSWKAISAFKIPLPPLHEQRKIAKILGTIQRAIKQQDKIIEAAKNLKKSLMQKLFTEGLYEEEQKETDVGKIPKSWNISNLGDICENITDCLHSLKPKEQKFGKICLQVYNIGDSGKLDLTSIYYISESDFKVWTSRIKPQKNDIIISKTGRVGAIAQILDDNEYCIGRNLVLIRPDERKIHPHYLRYYMLSPFFRKEVKRLTHLGTILRSLHVVQIPKLKIIIPSKKEQRQIASIFETIYEKIKIEKRKKAVLQELFKTMLHKVMTREIRLKDVEV